MCYKTASYSKQNIMSLLQKQTQLNETKINPHTSGQLIYDKRSMDIQGWKNSLLNKWCGENWTAPC